MYLTSRQDLADFCLRQLGAPVLNIEVADEQLDDAMESAIDFYQEYHFDGTERDLLKHKVVGTKLTLDTVSGLAVGQNLTANNTTAYVVAIVGNVVEISKMVGEYDWTGTWITLDNVTALAVGQTLTDGTTSATVKAISGLSVEISVMTGGPDWIVGADLEGPGTTPPTYTITAISQITLTSSAGGSYVIEEISLGDPDNGYLPISEHVQSVVRVLPMMGYSEGLFDITYQLRMNELWDLSSVKMSYFTTSMEYLSMLDFLLRKERQFRFNRRMNRLYLDINWKDDIKPGNYLIIDCYRAVMDADFPELVNDPWLKEYATVLVKRQWGANLRKYNGIALPGGMVLDGERIYREAEDAKIRMEQELINNQAPLKFMMG